MQLRIYYGGMGGKGRGICEGLRHKAAGGPEAYGGGGGSGGSGDDGGIHSCHRPISQDAGICMAQLVHIQIYLK